MSNIYTDPPQSRNEAIIKSTIDGTQYTDPPQSRMEDLLLDLKEAIEGGGGGGTTVVANPEGEATDELEKLQVGSDIYEIPKDYEEMDNKPSINSVELSGNKTASELGLQAELDGTQTVSGNPITVADAEAMNAESVIVELEPKQDLHGYDAPWVGGSGKNLLENVGTTTTIEGVTFTVNDDGSVTLNRVSSSANNAVFVINTLNLKEGTRYRIVNSFANTKIYIEARYDNTSGAFIASTELEITESFAIPSGSNRDVCVSIVVKASENPSNVIVYPMLGYSNMSNYTFAPYSNICPITGYSEVNVERVGKNLFDKTTATTQAYIRSSGAVYPNGNWRLSDYVRIEDEQFYTMSVVTMQSARYFAVCFYDENKEYVGGYEQETEATHVTCQATFDKPSVYARFCVHVENLNNFMFELGNQATTYEPYQGNTYTIDLDGTKYGGTLDVTEGVLTVDRASVDLGDLNWDYFTGSVNYFRTGDLNSTIKRPNSATDVPNIISSIYTAHQWEGDTPDKSIIVVPSGTTGYDKYLFIRDDSYNDVTTYKTAMDGVQLCYKLATPLTIQLTPTQIRMLENTNNISTDGTNIQLKYQPNNVIGECKAYTDEQIEKHNPFNYSTDEKAVGTWIDGKTIYQKTIEFDSPIQINNDYGTDITTYFTDIYDSIGTFVSAFSIGGSGNSCLSLYAQKFNNKVEIWRTINIAVTIENITIQYTKV